MDELKVFSGNAHPQLAREITDYLDILLQSLEYLVSPVVAKHERLH